MIAPATHIALPYSQAPILRLSGAHGRRPHRI